MVKPSTKENDDGSTDSGDERIANDDGSKTPKCPHILKSVSLNKIKRFIKQNGFQTSCLECEKEKESKSNQHENNDELEEYDRSLWLCLRCGYQFCGRAVNKHAIQHYEVKILNTLTLETLHYSYSCYIVESP